MEKVGQLIRLDPEKKYVMLIKEGILDAENMQVLALHMQKQEGGFLSMTLPDFDCVEFVENSDGIIDVMTKKEDGQLTAPVAVEAPKEEPKAEVINEPNTTA